MYTQMREGSGGEAPENGGGSAGVVSPRRKHLCASRGGSKALERSIFSSGAGWLQRHLGAVSMSHTEAEGQIKSVNGKAGTW